MEPGNNFKLLSDAGLISSGYEFSPDEVDLIEQLSPQEVEVLISTAQRLGSDFLRQHAPHGLLF